MYRSISLTASIVVPAFMLAVAYPANAADKAKPKEVKATNTVKVIHEDDRVRVTEATTKPGENNANTVRGKRVTRVLQGGTFERTYADGKKEKVERKAGQVIVAGPDKQAYWAKNIGNTTIMTYTVTLKEPKK